MGRSTEDTHIQYYAAELEVLAVPGVESPNPYLDELGEICGYLATSDGGVDGVTCSDGWYDPEDDESRMVYRHEGTGWFLLISQIGHLGVGGYRRQYFNPKFKNPGYEKFEGFGDSMGLAIAYQASGFPEEHPFWDLYSAIIERQEVLPILDSQAYGLLLSAVEKGLERINPARKQCY